MDKSKFADDDAVYFEYIAQLDGLYDDVKEVIYNFPVYVGAVNLARFFGIQEIFRQVIDRSGHIADVGTYKGASMLFFAKLVQLFEPYSQTEVHGFDWFKGMQPNEADDLNQAGKYIGSKARLQRLIDLQGLDDVCRLYDLDLTRDLEAFFAAKPWLRYKLVFLDCGIRDVLEASLTHFWLRLVTGGILIMDHYNNGASPSESDVIDRLAPGAKMLQTPYSRSPTAYLVKRG
jgi:hypothetical protein